MSGPTTPPQTRVGIAASCRYGSTTSTPSSPRVARAKAAARSWPTSRIGRSTPGPGPGADRPATRSPTPTKITEPDRAVVVSDEAVEVKPAVGDAGVVQAPQVSDHRLATVVSLTGAGPGRRRHAVGADNNERIAPPSAAGRDEPGHPHPGPLRQQRDETLVLDEFGPAAQP